MKCCDIVSRLLLIPAARGQDEGEGTNAVTISAPDDDGDCRKQPTGQTVISISQTKDGRLCTGQQFNVDGPVWSQQPQSLETSCKEKPEPKHSDDDQPPLSRRRLTLPNLYMDCGTKADDGFWRRSTIGRSRNRSRSSWTRIGATANGEGSTQCGRLWPLPSWSGFSSRSESESASAQWTSTSAELAPVTTCWQSSKLRQRLGKRQSTCDCPSDVSHATKSSRVWPSVHSFGRCSGGSDSSATDPEPNACTSHTPHDPHRHTINGHRRLTKASNSLPLLLASASKQPVDGVWRSSHRQSGAHSCLRAAKSVIVVIDNPTSSYLQLDGSCTSRVSGSVDWTDWIRNRRADHSNRNACVMSELDLTVTDSGDDRTTQRLLSSDHCSVADSAASVSCSSDDRAASNDRPFVSLDGLANWLTQSRSAPCTPRLPLASQLRGQCSQRTGVQTRSSDGLNRSHDPGESSSDSGAPSSRIDFSAMESSLPSSASEKSVEASDESGQVDRTSTTCGPSTTAIVSNMVSIPGRRFKLLSEGDIQLCRLTHSGTVINKILSSKFLRRWETHHLFLNDACLSSKTPSGFMENSVPYSSIKDINLVVGWDGGHRHCLRIVVADGSILLQANNAYIRDQWYHSIVWKKNVFRYHQVTRTTTRQEVLLKEVKSMVELATTTPLQDNGIAQAPFQLISSLLVTKDSMLPQTVLEDLLSTLSPLLERQQPSEEMCTAFSRHCQSHPRSSLVRGLFTSIVQRILKHNVDFGKHPYMRRFVQDYIRVLYAHNDGPQAVKEFVRNAHGEGSACPHPRVLPNLVAVCLASVFSIYENRRQRLFGSRRNLAPGSDGETSNLCRRGPCESQTAPSEDGTRLVSGTKSDRQTWDMFCYLDIINTISEFDDWRPGLAQLLQPIPFPDDALADQVFIRGMAAVVSCIGNDSRCTVHQCVLGIRESKEGWFHVVCPSSAACPDDGTLWASVLQTLLNCCCRRKKFLASMTKLLGACQLLALRDHASAQEALCLMLEWNLLDGGSSSSVEDVNILGLQVVTTLQSTESGRRRYMELCDRQLHLKELQQKGGPKKLTLPNRSTDSDLAKLLSCGSFGNLECLSLAFTQVTSACAEHLIKLPSLRYLNLWCTQFGDAGLALICEHLPKLQVLNLCETPVTDKGLACLSGLKSLRKLNLNSTNLSVSTFENLKQKLPSLQECDVRYTDAW